MTVAESPAYPDREIEELITALTGVIAAHVTVSVLGRVEEIHVLADEQLHPKQMVRNIESALSAGLGIVVDRRLVSIAQVRGAEAGLDIGPIEEPAPPASPEMPAPVARADQGRYVFVGYDARTQADLEASCRVTIRRGTEAVSGSGSGPSSPLGRAQAAARAVFAAITLARRDNALGLEGVTLVESHGRQHVLVSAHAMAGRETVPLTGAATLTRSPEEAAILAALQATNRWAEYDG